MPQMSGLLVPWLAVAVTLCACRVLGDITTWPGCPKRYKNLTVTPGVVDHEVTVLYLQSCNITVLQPNQLAYPNLSILSLEDNEIKTFEPGTFDSLAALDDLSLRNNKFVGKDLPSNLLRNCTRLRAIDIGDNNMTGAPAELLKGLDRLQLLMADNCSLRQMPSFLTAAAHPGMTELYLKDNQLSRLDDPGAFTNLPNLRQLNLDGNGIDYLHEDLLKPLANITEIQMRRNKLTYIPEHLFQNKSSLDYIDLSSNLIECITLRAFTGTKLKILGLRNNRLANLPDGFITGLRSSGGALTTFYYDNNPWSCGCLNELLSDLKKENINHHTTEHKDCIMMGNFQCHRPDIC